MQSILYGKAATRVLGLRRYVLGHYARPLLIPEVTRFEATTKGDTRVLSHSSQMAGVASLRIAGISGSLRKASTNTGLIRAAAEIAQKMEGVTFEIVDISNLPLLNEDLIVNGQYPEQVKAFRDTVQAADAYFFATPEYNYSITAALKNALDWGSKSPNVFDDKAVAIAGAGGGVGTVRSQLALRQVGIFLNMHFVNKEVLIKRFENMAMFDEQGNLQDNNTKDRIAAQLQALVDLARRLKA